MDRPNFVRLAMFNKHMDVNMPPEQKKYVFESVKNKEEFVGSLFLETKKTKEKEWNPKSFSYNLFIINNS